MSKSCLRTASLCSLVACVILLCLADSLFAAEPIVVGAAKLSGTKATLKASNPGVEKKTYVVVGDVSTVVKLPLGRVEVQAFVRDNGKGDAFRATPISLTAGGDAAKPGESTKQTVDALSAGSPLKLKLINRADRLTLRVQQGALSADAKKEVLKLETSSGAPGGPATDFTTPKKKKSDDPLAELGLSEAPPVDASAAVVPMVLLERIEIRSLSGSALVTGVTSDKLTYEPGETAEITVVLENLAPKPVRGKLTVEQVRGLSERTTIFSGDVDLAAGATSALTYKAPVGESLWGRGIEARLDTPEGTDVGTHAFSVVTNPWMVALHGRGLPQFGSETWTAEQAEQEAEKIARANMARYENMYEAFAWAPCDFSKMTIDDDATFHSGQTQYTKNRRSLATLHKVFHRYGLSAITYGKACAAGTPGVEYALRHPEQMNVFSKAGFAHESISVDVLDRMLEGRYRRHGRDEDFWQSWISSWTLIGNQAAIDFGCDEIVRSAKQFGWDGVRYDGHFNAFRNPAMSARVVKYAADRIQSQLPGFALGYNYCGPQHNTAEGAATDVELAACARSGGLIMSEYYRGILGPIATNIEHLRAVGDATRLHGGYFLCIADESSEWSHALMLAGGARPMGGGGHFNKFATRFSEYVFDPTMRRLGDPKKILRPTANAEFRWDAFVYEKPVAADRSLLIMQLVNATDELTLRSIYQPPTGVSGPRSDVSFQLALPAGYQAEKVTVCSDPVNFATTTSPAADGKIAIPQLDVWSLVVVELKRDPSMTSLDKLCEVPLDFTKYSPLAAEKWRAELQIGASVGQDVKAVNEATVKITPELLDKILAAGKPIDNDPGSKAYEPADFAAHQTGIDAKLAADLPEPPKFDLRRNGRPDVLVVRGVFSHWDRIEQAAAMLPGVEVRDAALTNGRIACSVALAKDNVACLEGWPTREELAELDVVVLDDIPATAFTLEQRRDLRDFVAAGGSLYVLGGWYSLSKGSWEGSFLEDVLPVEVVQSSHLLRLKDSVVGGVDFDASVELKKEFDVDPSAAVEWVNHVRVRPAATIGRSTGKQPLLVSGKHGAGQVVVWTGSHSGRPKLPYWESAAWPKFNAEILKKLLQGSEAVSKPAAAIAARLAKETQALSGSALEDALDGGSKPSGRKPAAGTTSGSKVTTDDVDRLRFLLTHGGEREALAAATYLLENPAKVDPKHYEELIEAIGPKITGDAGWSALGEKYLQNPPLLLDTLVAEIAAAAVKTVRFETIERWKLQDPVMRLRCIAAGGDAAALPTLEAELKAIQQQEAKWATLQATDTYSPATVSDIYRTRLLRPFLAQALWRCGKRDATVAGELAQGILELPYYEWRQHWVLDGARASLRDAIQQGQTGLDAKTQIRNSEAAIKSFARARRLLSAQLDPAKLGLEPATCQAVATALAKVDSRKSLPLALRYVRAIPADKLGEFAPLTEAKLADVRQLYTERSAAK